jgi:hypothetical protein
MRDTLVTGTGGGHCMSRESSLEDATLRYSMSFLAHARDSLRITTGHDTFTQLAGVVGKHGLHSTTGQTYGRGRFARPSFRLIPEVGRVLEAGGRASLVARPGKIALCKLEVILPRSDCDVCKDSLVHCRLVSRRCCVDHVQDGLVLRLVVDGRPLRRMACMLQPAGPRPHVANAMRHLQYSPSTRSCSREMR